MQTQSVRNLEITRVFPSSDELFVFAKYIGWFDEFIFLIKPDGTVVGRTSEGNWLELAPETAQLIKSKAEPHVSPSEGAAF